MNGNGVHRFTRNGNPFGQVISLNTVAAQTYHQYSAYVGVHAKAGQSAFGLFLVGTDLAAAMFIAYIHSAGYLSCNFGSRIRSAHGGGQNQQMIPYAESSIFTSIA